MAGKSVIEKTVVSVKMKATRGKNKASSWSLILVAYPVFENGRRVEKREYLNRIITTPIWDKSRPRKSKNGEPYYVKRDINGVIMCESAIDKEACTYADQVRNLRQREYDVSHIYDGHEEEVEEMEKKKKEDFFSYFERLNEQRHPDPKSPSRPVWDRVLYFLRAFCKKDNLPFDRIDMKLINDFRSWIQLQYDRRYNGKSKKLSNNSASKYFMLFRAGLRQAFIDGYLDVDLHAKTKAINKKPAPRSSFTMDEILKLEDTPCDEDVFKRAALFSVLTGLRLGDIRKLQWKHIRKINGEWRVDFVQSKTRQTDYLPISDQAYEQCGTPGKADDLVFEGIKTSQWISDHMEKWLNAAGIKRHLTFHCFRHTYATLQLENGTDIYTIKEMLGHTSVNTTQTYSHIVDPARRRAANLIHIEGLTIEF